MFELYHASKATGRKSNIIRMSREATNFTENGIFSLFSDAKKLVIINVPVLPTPNSPIQI